MASLMDDAQRGNGTGRAGCRVKRQAGGASLRERTGPLTDADAPRRTKQSK